MPDTLCSVAEDHGSPPFPSSLHAEHYSRLLLQAHQQRASSHSAGMWTPGACMPSQGVSASHPHGISVSEKNGVQACHFPLPPSSLLTAPVTFFFMSFAEAAQHFFNFSDLQGILKSWTRRNRMTSREIWKRFPNMTQNGNHRDGNKNPDRQIHRPRGLAAYLSFGTRTVVRVGPSFAWLALPPCRGR